MPAHPKALAHPSCDTWAGERGLPRRGRNQEQPQSSYTRSHMSALKKAISLKAKHKDPKGGLTAAGRAVLDAAEVKS